MAIHISPNRKVVSLTWWSAASYVWKNNGRGITLFKAAYAFFTHVYMTRDAMNDWIAKPGNSESKVAEDFRKALSERTIASSVATQTGEDNPPEPPEPHASETGASSTDSSRRHPRSRGS